MEGHLCLLDIAAGLLVQDIRAPVLSESLSYIVTGKYVRKDSKEKVYYRSCGGFCALQSSARYDSC